MKYSIPVVLLIVSSALAAPPAQESISTVLGPKAYRDGDVIEITDVTATSPRLEQGDSVTVTGRYRLKSHEKARLSLNLTQTEGDGRSKGDPTQTMLVSKGHGEFTLKTTIRHRGVLHVTFYDVSSGKPFGGAYFGTAQQMKSIADWDVGYYLQSNDNSRLSDCQKELQRLRRTIETLQRRLEEERKTTPKED